MKGIEIPSQQRESDGFVGRKRSRLRKDKGNDETDYTKNFFHILSLKVYGSHNASRISLVNIFIWGQGALSLTGMGRAHKAYPIKAKRSFALYTATRCGTAKGGSGASCRLLLTGYGCEGLSAPQPPRQGTTSLDPLPFANP